MPLLAKQRGSMLRLASEIATGAQVRSTLL
jgi:hypothetical protein